MLTISPQSIAVIRDKILNVRRPRSMTGNLEIGQK